jgi:hypothetical protein
LEYLYPIEQLQLFPVKLAPYMQEKHLFGNKSHDVQIESQG